MMDVWIFDVWIFGMHGIFNTTSYYP